MDKRSPLFLPVSILFLLAWLSYWLFTTRHALLDDALIHLHYADMLHRHHFITYDGIHHGFGTSSLLYVALLATLRGFFTSPLVPKAVSDFSYLVLIGLVVSLLFRLNKSVLAQLLLAELVLCLVSPMGIRWLTDGMETSLTCVFVVLLAVLVAKVKEQGMGRGGAILLALFGAAVIFLRIELALIVALSCLSILIVRISQRRSPLSAVIEASPLAIGAVLAMLAIRIVMGSFLPDTALAKSSHHISVQPLTASLQVLGSSLLLGIGSALCWAQSVFLVMRRIIRSGRNVRTRLLTLTLENCAIFVVVGLSCLRGQAIQGVRYVLWPFLFGVVVNALRIDSESAEETARIDPTEKGLLAAFLTLCLILLPVDWHLAIHAMRGRSLTFDEMRSAHLGRLFDDKTIVASDVGFITYFSNGRTCDLAGLVNGKAMAALTSDQRVVYCAQQSPAMLFLTSGQVHRMESAMDLTDWTVCGVFDFTNVHSNDRHYLIVPPKDGEEVCRALDFSSKTVADLVPAT